MRVGLISDTHIPGGAMEVPPEVARAFDGVELILHAGNIYNRAVLDWLERIAPVKAAGRIMGDRVEHPLSFSMEGDGDSRVAETEIMELEGHTVGMVNSLLLRGISDEILPGVLGAPRSLKMPLSELLEEFFGTPVDIVVFGRTHYAMVEEHQRMLFVNPGSPTLPRNLRKLGSVAILELTPEGREARVIDLASLR